MTTGVTPAPVQTEKERIVFQSDRFFEILKTTFETSDPTRYAQLLKMYEAYGERLTSAPASGKVHYHNAYEGGYIDHILNVYDCAIAQTKLLKKTGGWVDFTLAEVVMATFHHDLGKLGDPNGQAYYLIEESDWHRKNQNSMFKINEKLQFMKVPDRALFVLQQYGIAVTEKEYLAIKLTDGMYDEASSAYLKNHGKFPMHTNLPYVCHWADHMACTSERDPLKQEFVESITESD
jgi:hypothetical protein